MSEGVDAIVANVINNTVYVAAEMVEEIMRERGCFPADIRAVKAAILALKGTGHE